MVVDKGLGLGICIFTSLPCDPQIGPHFEQYYPTHAQCRAYRPLWRGSSCLVSPVCTLHSPLSTWINSSFPSLPRSHTSVLGDSCFCCSFGEFLLILQDSGVISSVRPSLTHLPPRSTGSTFLNASVLPVLNLIIVLIALNGVCLHVCLPIRLGDPGGQRPFLNYLCVLRPGILPGTKWHSVKSLLLCMRQLTTSPIRSCLDFLLMSNKKNISGYPYNFAALIY